MGLEERCGGVGGDGGGGRPGPVHVHAEPVPSVPLVPHPRLLRLPAVRLARSVNRVTVFSTALRKTVEERRFRRSDSANNGQK